MAALKKRLTVGDVLLTPLLYRYCWSTSSHDAVESHPLPLPIPFVLPIPLPPHEFIQVAGGFGVWADLHPLQLGLYLVPESWSSQYMSGHFDRTS